MKGGELLWDDGSLEVRLEQSGRSLWSNCQSDLRESGVPIPLHHRIEWDRAGLNPPAWYVAVLDDAGQCECGFPVFVRKSRSMPGHRVLRVSRLGNGASARAREAGARALGRLADREPRLLHIDVKVVSRKEQRRREVAKSLRTAGFVPSSDPDAYSHTLQLDLAPSPDEIFSSLHSSARRFIREPGKNDFEVRRLTDPRLADRVTELTRETFARTGGAPPRRDWRGRLEFAREHPDLYRVIGTFAPHRTGADALVAFVSGCHHGDHVCYADSASTRELDSNVSLSYAPTWKLVQWAREAGARWFDMGGIPVREVPDQLKGIADFKRYFTEDVARVRDEWYLEASPLRARAAQRVRSAVTRMRSLVDDLALLFV